MEDRYTRAQSKAAREIQKCAGAEKNILNLASNLQVMEPVTDCGDFDLTLRFSDGTVKHLYGSLTGEAMITSFGNETVSLTKLLRRYVPIYALWGFDGSLSPDYEGKKEIFLFAQSWEQFFHLERPSMHKFEADFGNACAALGFRMDCGQEFSRLYPKCFSPGSGELEKTISLIQDVDLLGSAVFSQWRYITHWACCELDQNTRDWFVLVLGQMKKLTKRTA